LAIQFASYFINSVHIAYRRKAQPLQKNAVGTLFHANFRNLQWENQKSAFDASKDLSQWIATFANTVLLFL
jgi:hypothetical protein